MIKSKLNLLAAAKFVIALTYLLSTFSYGYGYVTSITSSKFDADLSGLLVYDYRGTVRATPLPDQPESIHDFLGTNSVSEYGLVPALYNRVTGKYYPQTMITNGIYQLEDLDAIVSLNAAVKYFAEKYSQISTVIFTYDPSMKLSDACMQIAFVKTAKLEDSPTTDFITLPGGNCSVIPPADITCELSTTTLTLDHGTISSNAINGNSASGSIGVQCTDNVKLEVTATAPSINLGDGLDSYLYVNDHSMDTALDLDTAKNFTLKVESRLKKTGTVATGDYNGSYILIISPY